MLSKTTADYEFPVSTSAILKIANTPSTEFLLQAELKAIKSGLKYKEFQANKEIKYSGYFTQDGQAEGVGIFLLASG